MQTNVGKSFLRLITQHFPASHKYHKIFNKNTVKVSYSCMDNMERIIKKQTKKSPHQSDHHNARMQLPQKDYLPLRKQLSHSQHSVQRQSCNKRRPHGKELHRTNGRTLQTTLHLTRANFSEPTLRQQHGAFKIYLASQGQ